MTEKGSALPETIINSLASLENYKDKSSAFNYFGVFIEGFIHFRQRHYNENNSPQKILFDKNSQQQRLNDRHNKITQQTNLLASRLSGYLARTFALLYQAQQTDLSPWSEVETRARGTLIAQLLPVSYGKFGLSERLIQETRATLDGNTLANMKMNNLTHAATWKERQRREKGLVSSSTATDRIDNNVAHALEDFLFEPEGGLADTADNESGMSVASMSGQLALLLQGIRLTVNAASVLQQSGRYAAVPDEDMRFIDRIAGSGEKMFALVSALKSVVNSAAPTAHTLNDVPEKSVAKQASVSFYLLGRQVPVSVTRFFQPIMAPVRRLFRVETAGFAETRDLLKNSLGMHTLTTAEKSAVLQAVVIVKNLLQQTGANIQRVQLAAEPLSAALRYRAALEALLKQGKTSVLDSELARQRDVWQETIVQQRADLEAFIKQKRILLHQEDSDALQRLLAEVLGIDGANLRSAGLLNDIFSELKGYIRFITRAEEEIASTPDYLTKTRVEYTDLSTRLAPLLFQTKELRSLLNMRVSEWTGREPGSFSRSGMLAKGIAAWHQERRKGWLENIASTEQADAGKQYDAAFVTLIKPFLPILAKQHDAGGEVLLQRIQTEMANAAAGAIIYPTTMAEMLGNQKTMTEALQHSAIRGLIRQGLQAIFGSATLVPSLATLPMRILIRSLLTGARVAYMSHKGAQAVRLGEGSAKLEARQYGRNAFAQAAAKTALGAVKPVQSAVGIAFLLYEVYQGETKDAVRRLASELPVELGFESIRAVALKYREIQSEAEREETRLGIQRLLGKLSQESLTDLDANTNNELSRISDGDDPELATLAKKLQALPGSRSIRMRRSSQPGSYYDRATGTITLGSGASDKELMHEIAHALSAHQLVAGREKPDSPLGQHVRALEQLRMKARDAYIRMGGNDGDTRYFLGIDMNGNAPAEGTELEEFVAGLYSGNLEFIAFLRSIDAQGNSLLSRVINLLCLLLGLEQEQESAFTHAIWLSDTIMGTQLAAGEGEADGLLNIGVGPGSGLNNRGSTTRGSTTQTTRTAPPSQESTWGSMTAFPKGYDRTTFVAWLTRKSQNDRNSWIDRSSLSTAARRDLGIYLAENHFIYDRMVSGEEYFSWVREFKGWPANFQNDNRIVGMFRDVRADAKFPPSKGLRFDLKDNNGNILFEKTYYPQDRGNHASDPLVWHANILRQIERDMRMQPKGKRIAIHHLTNYDSANPGIGSGITGSKYKNFFVTETGSSVSSANFQFVGAESPVANSNLAKGDMSDYAALNQYLINEDDKSIDEKKEQFINTMIVASTADDDEVKSINDLLVVVYDANKTWEAVMLDEYLTKPKYLDAKYSMVVISKPTNMDTWKFDATSIPKSYPQLQQLFQSEHFRQKYGQFKISEVDGPEQDVYDENNRPREHIQDRARWKSSGQNLSTHTHTTRDLTFGEKIVVSVHKEGNLLEYMNFSIPREHLSKEMWPGYVALIINEHMKFVRVGETDITDSSRRILPQPNGNNTIWTRYGETVKVAIIRYGSAAIHPPLNNRPWQVPDEETWSETPPVLNLPTITGSDERLVLWVEDRRTDDVVEWIGIPPTNANTYKEHAESINSRASHIRVGELNNGVITPREGPGNIIWVDNENYVVKYSLAPASFYDTNKQKIQKHQLLTLMEGGAEKTKSHFSGSESNLFYAIPRDELRQIINLSPGDVRDEKNRIFQGLESIKIRPEPIENIVEIKEIKGLIHESTKFKSDSYINPPARSNASVLNYAKINAIRFMLYKYPDLASSNESPSASASEDDLLKILNEIYPVMTEEQKEEYSFINALYWNISSATNLAMALSTKLKNNLDVLSLRKEIMDSYYQYLSANDSWHGPGANAIMPRGKFDSDGAYYQQFNYYTNTGESLKDGVTEGESSEEQDVIDNKATNSDIKAQEHLDDAILKVVWKKEIRISKSDLDKNHSVEFKTTVAVASGDRTVPEITSTSKFYTLRDILLGNIYRDESRGIMSDFSVEDISGINGVNKSNLDGITKDIDQELRDGVEKLESSPEFKTSVKSAYDKVLAGVLIEILKYNQNNEVIDTINKYIDGVINLETVSVRKHGIFSSTKYQIPGVVALRGPHRTLLISLEKGTYRIIRTSNAVMRVGSNVETFINEHISRYDYEREEYSKGRTRWIWTFLIGGGLIFLTKTKFWKSFLIEL
ncbi:hypothetical protein [Pantoea sp. A4]|uniref:hypothetical protein n=1 Tax=Pantoea sp. A4 TaxID=1225184 RepID=UPI0003659059|nr:hypothetical protein [Pantoea sp. A4]